MNLATWSIRNPLPAILLFIVLSVLGLQGFGRLAIQNLPDIELPTVIVTLSQPGAAPAQLESDVARRVENTLASVAGLKHLRTTITEGQVQLVAEFVLERGLSDALNDVKNAVEQVRNDLPPEVRQPLVAAVTVGSTAVDEYTVDASQMSEEALSWYVDDTVIKAVLAIPGVGNVERLGGVTREIVVALHPARLASRAITVGAMSSALGADQQQSSGGRVQLGGLEQAVRTIATVDAARDLAARPIALADGRQVRLDEVASVTDTVGERTQSAILDGKRVLAFRVYRAKGNDEVAISAEVRKVVQGLQEANKNVVFTLINSHATYTLEQFHGSMDMLLDGALLAIMVVWLFLRDWRATLIAAAALPLSILPAFAVMHWLGYTLNTLTLLALSVVVGILVDDAIVEIENIERHVATGKTVLRATTDAVTEIALAVTATTLALVAVFIPTALMSGMPGLFFRQFGWTAVVALLSSLLVARLLTPMMAAHLLRPRSHRGTIDGALMRRYLAAADWCLRHRGATLAAVVLIFVASIALVPLLETDFLPAADKGATTVSFTLAPGSSLRMSEDTAEQVRRALAPLPGVRRIFASIGAPSSAGQDDASAGQISRGTVLVVLAPRADRPSQKTMEAAIARALAPIPGARFATGGEKLELILRGDDNGALDGAVARLLGEMRGVYGLSNLRSSASLERPELIVRPDRVRAAELGVSAASIGETMRIATSGDFTPRLSKLNLERRQVPIRVLLDATARHNLGQLGLLQVSARTGTVPLASVATLSLDAGPAQIDRYDRKRFVTVSADIGATALGTALAATRRLPSITSLSASVSVDETGNAELMDELLQGFGMALLTGIASVLCILVLLFKDVLQPLTILTALPLSIGGAFLGLLLGHAELDVPSMIGLIMLMGIVTKNSILLVEYAVVAMRERGLSTHAALIDACHKRARPIVMTTLAMIAGMLPIALGLGADASFRQPMAIAVIGGLVTSTALSLLVVPVSYACLAQLGAWCKGHLRGGAQTRTDMY